ncbi:DMT family transporter [Paracandidimonas soli]|uniref:Threonine/homoserine efflux transporter RhtA n=1 Tax=Paracandidimonas soli TaxID=1917182 RepID=A0A4R3V5U1_9BURK|nr:DMT family transporter [Paracandidimonas soli]TCU98931.1 threonine/homoserine efflux transporter RhtA [Paracandidimonas soli]
MPPTATQPALLPRRHAVAVLLLAACAFASNHVAARFAFDDQAGLLLAILFRSGLCFLALSGIVLWQRQSVRLPAGSAPWQLIVGLLIAIQSFAMFSAVARIPVAIALLISNSFPILLALLTWALGGKPPTRKACLLMGVILIGLMLVLDIPAQLSGNADLGPEWTIGVLGALTAATVFSFALWITEHKLGSLVGTVRSLYTVGIIFTSALATGLAGLVPGGLSLPASSTGWIGLCSLALLYTAGFSTLFVLIPKLDMSRNAPIMNVEPVFSLLLGWLLLGQVLTPIQLAGGAVVLGCIVTLAYQRHA